MKEHLIFKRVIQIVLMFLIIAGFTAGICIYYRLGIDVSICLAALTVVFFAFYLFFLSHNRSMKLISYNRKTSYKRVTVGIFLTALLAFGCSLLPSFVRPFLVLVIVMSAFSSEWIAFLVSFYFCVLVAIALSFPVYELTEYCLFLVFGCMISAAMDQKKLRFWYALSIFCLTILLPTIFGYLQTEEFQYELVLYGAVEGAFVLFFILTIYGHLLQWRDAETDDLLSNMADDSYPLARDFCKFSRKEYDHAKRVSQIAANCARAVGANEKICAAAGLYYRVGITEGDLIAQNGARIAAKHCFPEEVERIISEYQGKSRPISSVESAIVQIVDGLLKKFEVLDNETMSSTWNKDMLIYQTLNEYSSLGIYDDAGLSMNKFLKIREYLVKEETLI